MASSSSGAASGAAPPAASGGNPGAGAPAWSNQWSAQATWCQQDKLPRLPLPELQETLGKYVATVRPLLSEEDARATERAVAQFLAGEGPQLHAALKQYREGVASYVEEFWTDAYLDIMDPLAINVNPIFVLEDDPTPSRNSQVERAASLLLSSMKFVRALRCGSLAPDVVKKQALDMSQFKALFSSARLPRFKLDDKGNETSELVQDKIVTFENARHVVVMSRGQFYYFDVMWPDGTPAITQREIVRNLERILEDSRAENDEPGVGSSGALGVMTAEERPVWAVTRQRLTQLSVNNKKTLQTIDAALFVLCLDDCVTGDTDAIAANMLHGSYAVGEDGLQRGTCLNRWYDKLQIIVSASGNAGVCFEHSAVDGHTVLRFASDVFTDTIIRFAQTSSGPRVHASSSAAPDAPAAGAGPAAPAAQASSASPSPPPPKSPSAAAAKSPAPTSPSPAGAKSPAPTSPSPAAAAAAAAAALGLTAGNPVGLPVAAASAAAVAAAPTGVSALATSPAANAAANAASAANAAALSKAKQARRPETRPRKLEFDVDDRTKTDIEHAERRLSDLILQNETACLEFTGYGKIFITQSEMSPDAFAQIAMLSAYYHMYGRVVNMYESVMTKSFLHGRTEAGRSATAEAVRFLELWRKKGVEPAKKIEALRVATKAHTKMTSECAKGMGVDRHLYAMRELFKKQHPGKPLPAIYTDKAYGVLGTSVLSTSNCGNPSLRFFGFGPVTPQGFGIGYIIKEDAMHFMVTSKHRQTKRFVAFLRRYLCDVQDMLLLLEGAPSSSAARRISVARPDAGDNGYGFFGDIDNEGQPQVGRQL